MSFTGYRWWFASLRPAVGWQLRSVFQDVWWDGPHLTASLLPRQQNRSGIHAFKTLEFAAGAPPFGQDDFYPVFGAVALWGRVVEHELGYRTEHAVIRQLVIPTRVVISAWDPSGFCGCILMSGDFLPREATQQTPHPEMIGALARRYGVEPELGAEIECAGPE